MLEVDGVVSGYGRIEVLHGLSIKAKKGEFVTLIGPNGAGKTTALNTIFGLVKAKEGKIRFKGEEITNRKPHELVKKGLSLVPQGRAIFPSLTVQENLEMGAFIRKDKEETKKDMESVFQKFPILKERREQKAGSMSGGEQQMLAIGRGLMLSPELMMLDEPSLGLAPKIVKLIMDRIVEINSSGTTIVMVEQNARVALEVADRCYVLEMGRNKLEGSGKELLHDDRVRKIYLGEAEVVL